MFPVIIFPLVRHNFGKMLKNKKYLSISNKILNIAGHDRGGRRRLQPRAADQAHLDDGAPPAGRRQRVGPRQQGRQQQRPPDGSVHRLARTRYGCAQFHVLFNIVCFYSLYRSRLKSW